MATLQVLQSDGSATERSQRAIDSAEKLGNSWPLQALAVLQEELGIPLLLPYSCGRVAVESFQFVWAFLKESFAYSDIGLLFEYFFFLFSQS